MKQLLSTPTKALILKEWLYAKRKIVPLSIGLAIFGFLTVGMLKILPDLSGYLEGLIPEITPEMVIQSFMNSTNSIVSIIAVIICSDAIAGEREHNTLVLLQTKPLKSSSIILGKFLLKYFIMVVGTVVSAIVVYFSTCALVGLPNIEDFLLSLLVYLISLSFYVSVGIFVSSIAKSQVSAGTIGAATILLLNISSSLLVFEKFQPYNIFQLTVNIVINDFTALNIALSCLVLICLTVAILSLTIFLLDKKREMILKK
ncbi:MAG: ABC transporter permease [Candidatus Heimdallarchaeaceae archaeon]